MPVARCLLVIVVLAAWLPDKAAALTCDVSATDVVFGSVSPLSGTATDTSASISVNCSELIATVTDSTVTVCVTIGSGSGGNDGSATRYLQGVSGSLDYNLFKDSSRSQIWGSNSVFAASGGLRSEIALNGIAGLFATGEITLSVYGRLSGDLAAAEAETYTSNFTGQVEVRYGFSDSLPCDGASGQSDSDSMQVSATVIEQCEVTAGDLDFGAHSELSSNIDATASASVACSSGLPYTVALGVGTAPGATESTRALRSAAGDSVSYQLYRDASRTQLWGAGANSLAGSGSGSSQSLTIYGRIPSQALPPPGAYQDSVIATVSF